MSANETQRDQVRDVILTHAHLDHVAGLPLFLDDLFSVLETPVNIHVTAEIRDILERDLFNWSLYPRFSELSNSYGPIVNYIPFEPGVAFDVAHLRVLAANVNHRVPSVGFIVSDGRSRVVITGDTADMDDFWAVVNRAEPPDTLLIECAFPDELGDIAGVSHHLTPSRLRAELDKFEHRGAAIYAINLKPMYRETIVSQLEQLGIPELKVLEIGKVYDW